MNIDISEDLDHEQLRVIREILRMHNSDSHDKTEGNVLVSADEKYNLNYKNLRKAVQLLRSLNHKLRLSILQKIAEEENPTISDLTRIIRVDHFVLSQHLAILRRSNIVLIHHNSAEDKGLTYSLNFKWIDTVFRIIKYLAG